MDFVDLSHGWVVGDDGVILATSDGGATWHAQQSGVSARLEHVSFADAGHGWVTGTTFDEDYNATGSVLLATVDGGATWRLQDPGAKALLTDVSCVDTEHCWLAGTTIDADGTPPVA